MMNLIKGHYYIISIIPHITSNVLLNTHHYLHKRRMLYHGLDKTSATKETHIFSDLLDPLNNIESLNNNNLNALSILVNTVSNRREQENDRFIRWYIHVYPERFVIHENLTLNFKINFWIKKLIKKNKLKRWKRCITLVLSMESARSIPRSLGADIAKLAILI